MSKTEAAEAQRDPESWRGAINGKFGILSLILVAALVLALMYLLIVPRGGNDASGAVGGAPASSSGSSASTSGDARDCPPAPEEGTIPAVAPETTWIDFGWISVPSSPDFGPSQTSGNIGNCFAHSPTGALFAAAYTSLMWSAKPDGMNLVVFVQSRYVESSPSYTAMLTTAQQPPIAKPVDTVAAELVAFRFVDYTSTRATVSLALNQVSASGGYHTSSLDVTIIWEGDWKVVADSAQQANSIVQEPNLSNYVPWKRY